MQQSTFPTRLVRFAATGLGLFVALAAPSWGALSAQTPDGSRSTTESGQAPTGESAKQGPGGEDENATSVELAAAPAERFEAPEPRYPTVEDVARRLGAWDRAGGEAVTSLDLGTTAGGRVVPAIQFGRLADGAPPLEERPTLFLIGGIDGRSLSGTVAILFATQHLLERLDELSPNLCIVSIPMGSPDALTAIGGGRRRDGANDRPLDDDGDGRVDEDGPDDLDGDGLLLDMLIEDPRGAWTRSSDPRFLLPAREGDSPRYRLVPEGRDDDGDGRYNEDAVGGIVLDRHFPVGWTGPRVDPSSGGLPLDEGLARHIAELMQARQTTLVLELQGSHGGLRWYGGEGAPGIAQRVAACFDSVCNGSSAGIDGEPGEEGATAALAARDAGSLGLWAGEALGAMALEISSWGPPSVVEEGPLDAVVDLSDPTIHERRAPSPLDERWGRWLDDERGGLGFRRWQEIELEPGLHALVGGWEPQNRENPPSELLAESVAGIGPFVGQLIDGLPKLELRVRVLETRAGLTRFSARLANVGALPTGPWGRRPCHLELELPVGAELLAGRRVLSVPTLAGGSASERIEWLVRLPEGERPRLRASAPWAATIREVVR